jgi:hypothetical protein
MHIFKYEIPIEDDCELMLPKNAKILSFQIQNDKPVIWAIVDVHRELETRKFMLRGTGHTVDETKIKSYLGTIQLLQGSLVFHLFEAIT